MVPRVLCSYRKKSDKSCIIRNNQMHHFFQLWANFHLWTRWRKNLTSFPKLQLWSKTWSSWKLFKNVDSASKIKLELRFCAHSGPKRLDSGSFPCVKRSFFRSWSFQTQVCQNELFEVEVQSFRKTWGFGEVGWSWSEFKFPWKLVHLIVTDNIVGCIQMLQNFKLRCST